ncbi:MAG TPA: caspase family protein, partial [Pyrinomonadaceae bacterium]|nr:caspase family protein [Pyrinomonadaceae bacterium]
MDIAPLPAGSIVYGTAEPSWGILNAQHKQAQPPQAGQIADYRNNLAGFLTDANAGAIRFAYELFGRSPAVFNLPERTLKPDTPAVSNLRPPRTDAPGLSITDWKDTYTPRFNNSPLKLEKYEMSRSLAIAPDGKRFLLGTEWRIRLFNSDGQEVWSKPTPGVTWGVNISGDGRYALAAYSDGTIRWHRMTDGEEVLAFFPHADRERWILWTPAGYYDASPGAEELIGWHVNNGPDAAADFFPVGQFRDTYYRPDVIARVLQAGDESRALQLANEESGRRQQQAELAKQLPPVVEIISPADDATISSGEVTLRFNVRSPSGEPVTSVKALVDGRPAGARQLVQGEATSNGTREIRVGVPERDSVVSLIAENRFAASTPATVRLKWRAAARPESFVVKPKLYVLAVGVSRYNNPKYNLLFADKDARDFVATMQGQKGLLYRDVVMKILTDEQATKDEILDGLDWIRKETTSNDVAMVFFAGHGVNDQNNYYYFCPHNIDPERLLRTGV